MMPGFSLHVHQNRVESEIYFSEQYDNIHFKTEHFEFALEGLILNKKKLLQEFAVSDFKNFISERFHFRGIQFIDEFEGEFRGFIHDFQKNRVFVFTNPTATQRVFYTKNEKGIFIDSSLVRLNKTVKTSGISTKPDMESLYQLLTFGNTLEGDTPIFNVKKLLDGHFLDVEINNLIIIEKQYCNLYVPTGTLNNKGKAIKEIDFLFKEAVKLEYEKDIEIGTKHFSLLSGGLDSRVAILYANKMQMKPDEVFCFSQSNYLDETVSRKIAKDYEIPYSFVPLDKGKFLKNIDRMTEISEGTSNCFGAIHMDFAFQNYAGSSFSIVHTGQVGGGVLGTFIAAEKDIKPRLSRMTANNRFLSKIESTTLSYFKNFDVEEHFLLRNIGFNKLVIGHQTINQYAHKTAPFMETNFLKFVFSLPANWKYKNKFYLDWIKEYCGEATKYTWERTRLKPDAKWKTLVGDKFVKRYYNIFYNRLLGKEYLVSMYPYQYYYDSSKEIQDYYQIYFNENFERISDYPELSNDVKTLFQSDKFTDKSLAVNVLSIFKLFFD